MPERHGNRPRTVRTDEGTRGGAGPRRLTGRAAAAPAAPADSPADPVRPDGAPPPTTRGLLGTKLWTLGAGELASRVFGFVAMSYLFRTLAPASYGYLETTVAVLMFCQIAVELGLPVIGTREVARDRASAPALARRIASMQSAFAAGVLGLLAAAAFLLPMPEELSALLFGFGIGLLAIPFTLTWVFQGRDQMFAVALPKAVRYAVFLAGAVLFVRGPDDVLRLPAAEIAGAAAGAVVCVVLYLRGGERLRLDPAAVRDGALLRETLPICGSTLLWAVRMYVATVWMLHAAGPEAAGLFGAAQRIVLVMIGILDMYFVNLFPRLAVAGAASRADLRRLVARSMHLLLWPTLAGALVAPWIAPWVMRTVYGSENTGPEAGRLLATLSWLVPIIVVRAHARFTLFALGGQRWEFTYSVAGVVVFLALLVPLGKSSGVSGAAAAMLASEAFATALGWTVLLRRLRDGPGGDPAAGASP